MTYFIINAPYEQCFEWFFKDEYGYPNFYRLNELLASDEQYEPLILLAIDSQSNPLPSGKISEKAAQMGLKYLSFGDKIETRFTFDEQGKLRTHPLFQEALDKAIQQYLTPSAS